MKLLTNDKTYEGVTFRPTADGCVITAREAIEPDGVLVIQADDGAELCRYTVADWLRCETDGGTLTLSNSPAPEPPPEPEPPSPSEEEILAPQIRTAGRALLAPCAVLTDDQALAMPDLVRTWEEALEAGAALDTDTVLRHDGVTYRVVQPVTPQAHQPPGSEGMLAIYRPIETQHAGTEEDPIPFVYGMDALAGLYYSYAGGLYQVAKGGDMKPCVWLPDSGIWQWVRTEGRGRK